jgi:hypothetical protein
VAGSFLLIAARSLRVSDVLSPSSTPFQSFGYSTSAKVSAVVGLVGAVALAAAFGLSWAGFVQHARQARVRMLAIAGGLFAVYGAAAFASALLALIELPSGEPWKFMASASASVADGFALLVAAVLVAVGVSSARPGRLLGWGCLALAGHYLLTVCVYGFALAGLYDFASPDARVLGFYIASTVGYFVIAGGAIKAAIAFATGGSRRDRELGVAAVLFAAGFLMASVGLILSTSSPVATVWLNAAYLFMLSVAAGVGAAAFFSSEQRDGSDIAVMPDPA